MVNELRSSEVQKIAKLAFAEILAAAVRDSQLLAETVESECQGTDPLTSYDSFRAPRGQAGSGHDTGAGEERVGFLGHRGDHG